MKRLLPVKGGREPRAAAAQGGRAHTSPHTQHRRADLRARRPECALPRGHVHTHSCTRAAESSETCRAGAERRCCARTALSPPRSVYTHTHLRARTCPEQTHPSKGTGDGQLSPEKQLGLPPSRKGAQSFAIWAEVGEGLQKSGSRPAHSNRPASTLEGPPRRLGKGKTGRRHLVAAQRSRLRQGEGAALTGSEAPTAPAPRPRPHRCAAVSAMMLLFFIPTAAGPAQAEPPLFIAAGPPNLACVRAHPLLCLFRHPFGLQPWMEGA